MSWAAAIAASAALAACLEPREREREPTGPCTSCHGSAARDAEELLRSAPPVDIRGNTSTEFPGVGAHQAHLDGSPTHGPVRCEECHEVPGDVASDGHADTALPAEVIFGSLASSDDHAPEYAFSERRCSDTYCHGARSPLWTAPRSSEEACGSCHGLPPPPPHPQSDACFRCHGEVIDAEQRFTRPERHVDGTLDVEPSTCSTCHGDEDSPAPPPDLDGETERTARGVGAHRAHLEGGRASRALQCDECHLEPDEVDSPGHLDESPGAEVVMTGVAQTADRSPAWDRAEQSCTDTWCHGPTAARASPDWTAAGALECSDCHGMPPPLPHPQFDRCGICHARVAEVEGARIHTPELHVNGNVEVEVPPGCTTCHGEQTPAPPPDLSGNTETVAPGVGAHQTHVTGGAFSRAVPCEECHPVPSAVLRAGHLDSPPPAELSFSGVAAVFGAEPEYADNICTNTFCHGGAWVGGAQSGGTETAPNWTLVDGSQAACGACHGLPPPSPRHPETTEPCSACHLNVTDALEIIDPTLHVNGEVDF